MIQKVKDHFHRNRDTYKGVAIGASAVGTAVIAVCLARENKIVITKIYQTGKRATVNDVTIHLVERSTPSKPVHLVGSNQYFSSLNEAARETGCSVSAISRQVNGHSPVPINGHVFEVLDVAS